MLGDNRWGQLGLGFSCPSGSYQNGCNGHGGLLNPSIVTLPNNLTATAVSTSLDGTCAILADHSVWCWGDNGLGKLGTGIDYNYDFPSTLYSYNPAPVVMPTGFNATGISSGYQHSCMLGMDSRVFCWGLAQALGAGSDMSDYTYSDSIYYSSSPVEVSSQSSFVSISVGTRFSCAITTNSTVECWGTNSAQQLGAGLDVNGAAVAGNNEYHPIETDLPTNSSPVSISLGDDYACAIMSNMSVYCWGDEEGWSTANQTICQNGVPIEGCYYNSRAVPIIIQLPTGRAIAIVSGETNN